MVDLNHSVLKSTPNAYAPEKKHLVVHRPCAPWYSDDFSVQKNIRRKLERKWRSSKLPADSERYVFQNCVVNNMNVSAKQDYYSTKIQENSGNTRILFKTVEKLGKLQPRPTFLIWHCNLSESFVDFFINKIVRIRNDLDTFSRIPNDSPVTPYSIKTESCFACLFFSEFRLVDEEVISGYVNNLCTKSCADDGVATPSSVFQRCQHRLVPIITRIVNLTLQGGQVPDRFKVGVMKPLLKQSGADHENFSNFRPASNLYFLCKVTEKAVNEDFLEEFQSA